MIEFLNTAFLWALPLAGLPMAIHLLSRRRREVVPWGAMQFLLEALPRRRRIAWLQDLLLMTLRSAIVLLIILALAQPRLTAGWLRSARPQRAVLILDDSLSTCRAMAGQAGSGSVFDHLIAQAADFVHNLRPGDRLSVLLASQPTEWLTAGPVTVNDRSRSDLIAALRGLQPGSGTCDLPAAIRQALDAATPRSAVGQEPEVSITILSDGQARDWRPAAAHAWRAIAGQRSDAGSIAIGAVVPQVSDQPPVNLALDSFEAVHTVAGPGEGVRFETVIRNTGSGVSAGARLRLTHAGYEVASASVPPLAPGENASLRLDYSFDTPGVQRVAADITPADDLLLDNHAEWVVEVTDEIRVLVIDGEGGSGKPPEAESRGVLLLTALGWHPQQDQLEPRSVYRPAVISQRDVTPEQIRQARCVILLAPDSLRSDVLAALHEHVRSGCGLWILPDEETDPETFNRALHAAGRGVAPMLLGELTGEGREPFLPLDRGDAEMIAPPSGAHPATRLLADTERLDLNRARVYRRFELSAANPQEASVLLATGGGAPLAVEKKLGRGRVIQMALPFHLQWSTLPLCQAFVVLVREWVSYLVEPGMTTWNISPGQPLVVRMPDGMDGDLPADQAAQMEASVRAVRPGRAEVRWPAVIHVQGHERVVRFARPLRPGSYDLLVKRPGGERVYMFTVRRDPAESDLTPLSDSERRAIETLAGIRFLPQVPDLQRGVPEASRPQPAWTVVVIGLLMLILAESLFSAILNCRRAIPATTLPGRVGPRLYASGWKEADRELVSVS